MIIKNWPLMWKTIEHIIDHPEDHDQSNWLTHDPEYLTWTSCGTSACVAGWAALSAGYVPVEPHSLRVALPGQDSGEVPDIARKLLFADDEEDYHFSPTYGERGSCANPFVEDLFAGSNSVADILDMVMTWADLDGVETPGRVQRVRDWMAEKSLLSLMVWPDWSAHKVRVNGIPA